MARMSAQLIVSLIDGISGPAAKAKRSLTALEKAERDVALARHGDRLSRTQLAEERLLAVQEMESEKRLARVRRYGAVAGAAIVASGYAAIRAARSYAQLERTIGRIMINADKPAEAIKPTIAMLQQVADTAKMPFDDIVSGLETLIASGRSLEDALAFLPTIAMTAQASGSAVSDIALTADALAGSMGIAADRMQSAFDILVEGGKAGKFELFDMAKELPALAPAFAQLGYKGEEGLKQLVAMLQIVRNQTGSSAEAATNFGNVLQKVYSAETANKFEKFGIDIVAILDKTRKEGGNILMELVAQTNKALDGDMSKLSLLFTDAQVQKGMRALITQLPELTALMDILGKSAGSTARAVNQITGDAEGNWQTLANNIDKVAKSLGNLTGQALNPALKAVGDRLSELEAIDSGARRLSESGRDQDDYREQFYKEWRKLNPDAGFFESRTKPEEEFRKALVSLGRGEIDNIFDPLRMMEHTRKLAREYGRAQYVPGKGAGGDLPENIPVPQQNPRTMTRMQRMIEGYNERGGYVPAAGATREDQMRGQMAADGLVFDFEAMEAKLRNGGAEAGSQVQAGMSQGGADAASALRQAGDYVAARLRAELSNLTLNIRTPPGLSGTTGAAVTTATHGAPVDGTPRR